MAEPDPPTINVSREPYLIASRRTVRAWTIVATLLATAALVGMVALGLDSHNANNRLERNGALISELQHQLADTAATAHAQEACHERTTAANVRANGQMLSTIAGVIETIAGGRPRAPEDLLAELAAAKKQLDLANISATNPPLCG